MLTLKNYSVFVGDKTILKDLSLTFEKGKVYVLMGPNGSGKSTLALSLMGISDFTHSPDAQALLEETDLLALTPEERSQAGLFTTFQSPPSLSGVTVFQLLRLALEGKRSPQEVRSELLSYAKALNIPQELLSRSLNEGFSGGERKKIEMLQVAVMKPKVVMFDEIDTGVDIDALRTITEFVKKHKTPDQTYIFITHQKRLAEYVSPNRVVILKNGTVARVGDDSLVKEVEEKGYEHIV